MISGLFVCGLLTLAACSQTDATQAAQPKLYVFECGRLHTDDVEMFGLTADETAVRELFVPCYLIDHPSGQMLWDSGLPLEVAGQGTVALPEGTAKMSYARSVVDQLQDIGLTPEDVELVALSHMHFDHSGGASAFGSAKLLIQQTEYDAAFVNHADFPMFDFAVYGELANAQHLILNGDHDVFGDGSVRIISTPGHTPGHQSLLINLANYGPLVLSGDLYHFRASRKLRRTPVFNTDAQQTLRSMDKLEAIINDTGATLWIEHDKALAETLNLAPAFYD